MPLPIHSHIYLDESGDLGWSFCKPYRSGGSSRFLTLGYLITPTTHINIPKRLVKEFYQKFNFPKNTEVKASMLKSEHKNYICNKTVDLIKKYPDFKLGTITVKKESVAQHVRNDGNSLYNFMIGDSIIPHIKDHHSAKLTRDNRTIKMASGLSCRDYIQTIIWFHRNKETHFNDNPTHSHLDDGLIYIDWITNIIWTKYEDGYLDWANIIAPYIEDRRLYF